MRLHSDSPQSLPHTIAEVQTYGRLAAAFPGQQATQQVVVVAPAAASETVVAQLEALFGWHGGGMAALYTRSADRVRLGKEAAGLLVRNDIATSIPT